MYRISCTLAHLAVTAPSFLELSTAILKERYIQVVALHIGYGVCSVNSLPVVRMVAKCA